MSHMTLSAETGAPLITIERVFAAPPEKVFRLFSEATNVARWWSPFGQCRIDAFDPRVGGSWRIAEVMDEGEIAFFGVFHDLSAPHRIVQTSEFANLPERGHVVLERYEFTPVGTGTRMVLTESFLSVADRDAAIESGMEEGVVQQYRNIDALLAEVTR